MVHLGAAPGLGLATLENMDPPSSASYGKLRSPNIPNPIFSDITRKPMKRSIIDQFTDQRNTKVKTPSGFGKFY